MAAPAPVEIPADDDELGSVGVRVSVRPGVFDKARFWEVNLSAAPESQPPYGATVLVKRCIKAYNWVEVYACKVLAGYRRFLALKRIKQDWRATILYPSTDVGRMWHQHILDVNNYALDCMLLCGHVVGYNPDATFTDEEANKRRRNTAEALLEEFPSNTIERTRVWKECFPSHNDATYKLEVQDRETMVADDVQRQLANPSSTNKDEETTAVCIRGVKGGERFFQVSPSIRMHKVFDLYEQEMGLPRGRFRFLYKSRIVSSVVKLHKLDLQDGEAILAKQIRGDLPAREKIMIRVQDPNGARYHWTRVHRATRLQKVFASFAERIGLQPSEMRFAFKSRIVGPDDTVRKLGMRDRDTVFAIYS